MYVVNVLLLISAVKRLTEASQMQSENSYLSLLRQSTTEPKHVITVNLTIKITTVLCVYNSKLKS